MIPHPRAEYPEMPRAEVEAAVREERLDELALGHVTNPSP